MLLDGYSLEGHETELNFTDPFGARKIPTELKLSQQKIGVDGENGPLRCLMTTVMVLNK